MSRVLMATDVPFWEGEMGNHQRIISLCRHIVECGHTMSVFYAGKLKEEETRRACESCLGVTVIPWRIVPNKAAFGRRISYWGRRLSNVLSRLAFGAPDAWQTVRRRVPTLREQMNPDIRTAFEQHCEQIRPDVVLVEYVNMGYLADGLSGAPESPLLMMDTLDVMSDRHETFMALGLGDEDWLSISQEEEQAVLDRFDVVMAIHDEDAALFRTLLRKPNVIVVSHAPSFDRPVSRRMDGDSTTGVLFVGGRGPANRDAALYILKELWPPVLSAVGPRATLLIAGGVCDVLDRRKAGQGVRLIGRFDSLSDLYSRCDIVLNPVRAGGGLKIKNVEALCCGKVLITSSLGAAGMRDGVAEGALCVSDATTDTIDLLNRMIRDANARKQMSQKAQTYAMAHFSQQEAYRSLDAELADENLRLRRRIPR